MIQAASGEALFIYTDVSRPFDCENLVIRTVEKYGRLDFACNACNNAGVRGEQKLVADYSIEGWQKVIAVNLSGVFYCMKYKIPEMLKSGDGAIVNMASILGQVGFANVSAYVAAKHRVIGLTKTLRLNMLSEKFGSIRLAQPSSPLIADLEENPDVLDGLISLHPIGRFGNPEEVAELVIWPSSNRASFVTGAYYLVDGGYLAR